MLNKKEVFIVAVVILITTLSINLSLDFFSQWNIFLATLLSISIIILGNIFAKKLIAYFLDSEIEVKLWEVKTPASRSSTKKHNIMLGAFLPLFSKMILFPFKNFIWMASLVFDVRPRIYRGAKRYGLYTFSDITEYHMGLIAASGIVLNLIFAVSGYLLGFSQFAALNIFYAFFSILPLSELDGNKILFGSKVLWSMLASIVLIAMLLAVFII
jgi:hypothetical protein